MKTQLYHLIFIALLALCACQKDKYSGPAKDACDILNARSGDFIQPKIIDGTTCPVQGSPVVSITLLVEDGNVGICSGTIISPRHVLTAAHCYLETQEGAIIGSSVSIEGVDYNVRNVFVHPDANVPQNDVAIVELKQATSVEPVPILLSDPVESGDIIAIFGYGIDENSNFANLKSGEMKITGISSQNIFARFSGKGGSNVCFGDSGGPALVTTANNQIGIVGVTSFGTSQGCVTDSFAAFANLQGNQIFNFVKRIVPSIQTL